MGGVRWYQITREEFGKSNGKKIKEVRRDLFNEEEINASNMRVAVINGKRTANDIIKACFIYE